MKKFLKKLWIYLKPFTNWKFVISFGLAWMITNGWCYLFIVFGSAFNINWMWLVGTTYAAILYFPFTVEKLITIPMAMWFQNILFKKDVKLRHQFEDMKQEAIKDWHSIKEKTYFLFKHHKIRYLTLTMIGYDKHKYKYLLKRRVDKWKKKISKELEK